jgi:hypothetical protein
MIDTPRMNSDRPAGLFGHHSAFSGLEKLRLKDLEVLGSSLRGRTDDAILAVKTAAFAATRSLNRQAGCKTTD